MNNVIIYKNIYYQHEVDTVIPYNKMENVSYLCANNAIKCNNVIHTNDNTYQCINPYVNFYTNIYYVYKKECYLLNCDYIGFLQSYYNIYYSYDNLKTNDIIFHINELKDKTLKECYHHFYDKLNIYLDDDVMNFVDNNYYIEAQCFICNIDIFKDFMFKSLIPFLDKVYYLYNTNKKILNRNAAIHACVAHITYYFYNNFRSKLIDQKFDIIEHKLCH